MTKIKPKQLLKQYHSFSSQAFATCKIRWFFCFSNSSFSVDRTAFWQFILIFLLSKLACDRNSAWQSRHFCPDNQIISALVCFFRFFHANLLSAIKLVRWIRWRAWCLATPNQSGSKVHQSQSKALCKGLIINELTAAAAAQKSLQNHLACEPLEK